MTQLMNEVSAIQGDIDRFDATTFQTLESVSQNLHGSPHTPALSSLFFPVDISSCAAKLASANELLNSKDNALFDTKMKHRTILENLKYRRVMEEATGLELQLSQRQIVFHFCVSLNYLEGGSAIHETHFIRMWVLSLWNCWPPSSTLPLPTILRFSNRQWRNASWSLQMRFASMHLWCA